MPFELGEDERLPAGGRRRTDQRTERGDVGGAADKAEGNRVNAVRYPPRRIGAILRRQRRDGQGGTGQVEALEAAEGATADDLAGDEGIVGSANLHLDPAVVNQDRAARPDLTGQRRILHRQRVAAGGGRINGEQQRVAGGDGTTGAGHRSQTHLGALQILEDRQRSVQLAGDPPQPLDHQGMGSVSAVREVQSRHVHAGADHRPQRGLIIAGGTDGGDDTRAAGWGGRCRHEGFAGDSVLAVSASHPGPSPQSSWVRV